MFASSLHIHQSLIFSGTAGAYHSGSFTGLHPNGRLQTLPTNIKLGWRWVEVANTLAYYDTAAIMAVKSFVVKAVGDHWAVRRPVVSKTS